jgi:hypothetical protein
MLALWPLGRYGAILGQNHKILITENWKKCMIILLSSVF